MIINQEELEQEFGKLEHSVTVPKNEKTVGDKIGTCLIMILPSGFVALLVGAGLFTLIEMPLATRQVILLILTVVIHILVCRAVFKYESKEFLALFEDGFAVRCGWQRKQYRFNEIENIGFGQILTDLENKLQGVGWLAFILSPKVKRVHDDAARFMITVISKSGKREFLKGVLIRFPEDATKEFFTIFQEQHPDIWS